MELARSTSRGGFSVRSIFVAALTVLVTALLATTLFSAPTHAADSASWKGDTVMFSGHQYFPSAEAKEGETHGLAVGTKYYVYIEEPVVPQTQQKAHVIYFAPGTDPPVATSATYVVYDVNGVGANMVYSNPQNQQSITITPQSETDQYASSCMVDGIGWIICPISVFLAQGMDTIFDILRGFIEVQPPQTGNTTNSLYVMWNIMRSVANVAFIIAFLIIIYSQMTSIGISNYGLKKIIPRLIIAAIAVNLSYYICAFFIDVSNILGYSLQDIFIQIRNNTFNITNDTWSADVYNWESITGFVLSGGTATAALGVGIGGALLATAGDVIGLIFLILPALLALLLAVLVVLVILAARQAIIIILVIIAPLAFVAYLLPNTENLFEKWRGLFITMLVFFPAFSLVFGGSQLAGAVIIQNANSINVIILGMIVQIAPLVITPLLLKLSGNLLGKIAGIINDPRKGLVDRARNWSNNIVEDRKYKKLEKEKLNPFDLAGRAGRGLNRLEHRRQRSIEAGKAGWEGQASRYMATTRRGQQIEMREKLGKLEAEDYHDKLSRAMEDARAGDAEGLNLLRQEGDSSLGERIQSRVTGVSVADRRMNDRRYRRFTADVVSRAAHLDQEARITASATHKAQEQQEEIFAKALAANENLRIRAGGIDREHGADSALASAINTIREAYGKSVTEARAINKQFDLSAAERQKHAVGRTVHKTAEIGGIVVEREFTADSIFTREAAIEDQITLGTAGEIEQLVGLSGTEAFKPFRETIASTLGKSPGQQAKVYHIAGQSIDDIAQGRITGEDGMDWVTARMLARGKLSEREITSLDPVAVNRILKVINNPDAKNALLNPDGTESDDYRNYDKMVKQFSTDVAKTFIGDERGGIKAGARDKLLEIAKREHRNFDPADESTWPQ